MLCARHIRSLYTACIDMCLRWNGHCIEKSIPQNGTIAKIVAPAPWQLCDRQYLFNEAQK